MSTNDHPERSGSELENIGNQNVERLLANSYDPEPLDPDFIERVRDRAQQESQQKVRASGTLQDEPSRSFWHQPGAWVAACAVVLLLTTVTFLATRTPDPSLQQVYRDGQTIWIDGKPFVPASLTEHEPRTTQPARGFRPAPKQAVPSYAIADTGLTPGPLSPRVEAERLAEGQQLKTRAGQQRRVTLADGSELYVNEETTLTVLNDRRISVESGKVFIDVAPAELPGDQPTFVVETPDREVAAWGTKFAVEVEKNGTGVLVTQGKVQVSGLEPMLRAGQQLYPDPQSPVIKPLSRATAALDWMRDLIVAANSPLVPRSEHCGGALLAIDPRGQEVKLSLRKYHIDVHIEDGFARTTIDQTYFNHCAGRLEGTFYFPLPADASISRLAMYVNGKLMEGGMAERDRAREVFETIKHRALDPALLEWVDGTTFKMRVFPLEGRQEKRIVLSYTQKLGGGYGETHYRFPAGHNMKLQENWSANVNVVQGSRLNWECPSHQLTASMDGDILHLKASGIDVRGNRDLVIKLIEQTEELSEEEVPVQFRSIQHEGKRYMMARWRPRFEAPEHQPRRDWVFLLDADGSRNPLLARAQNEIVRTILDNAGHDDTFAIVTAGTRIHAFAAESKKVSPDEIEAAQNFLDSIHLVGALDLRQALSAAREFAEAVPNPTLVHVGAGIPILGSRDLNELLSELPEAVPYVGVGVGRRWNRNLMRRAAADTGGYFTQINPDEPIQWRTMELLATLNAPRLLDTQVVADDPQVQFYTMGDSISDGEEICAITRLDDDRGNIKTITIRGRLGAENWQRTIPVESIEDGAAYLPRTWAKLAIDDMVMRNAQANRDEIIALSKAMYVMSPFTSLLVLENDAMYDQYNIDRGRKDHWALYPCPEQIDVVHEPMHGTETPDPAAEGTIPRPSPQDVLRTLVWRLRPGATQAMTSSVLHGVPYRVPDGGTVLLGGIRRFHDGHFNKGVPKLSKVPYTNRLFTNKFLAGEPLPLRMMVTPRIIIGEEEEPLGLERWEFEYEDFEVDFEFDSRGNMAAQTDFDTLVELITETIEPDTWEEVGGDGLITPFPTDLSLVISQTQEVLTEELLTDVYPAADFVLPAEASRRYRAIIGRNFQSLEPRFGFPQTTSSFAAGHSVPWPDISTWDQLATGRYKYRSLDLLRDFGHRARTQNDQARATLDGRDGFEFKDMTIRDIVKYFRERHEISIELRDDALSADDPAVERKRITLSVSKCSLRSALRLVLDKLNLTYYLDRGTVYITTLEDYHEQMKLRSRWLDETLLLFHAHRDRTAADSPATEPAASGIIGSAQLRLVDAWSRQRLARASKDQSGPALLYPTLRAASSELAFRKLADFAPGNNTALTDVLAVLESEAELKHTLRQGEVDEGARQLVNRSRSPGWRTVSLPGLTITLDGAGRFRCESKTKHGLREIVIHDGTHLWHLYPELGIGTRRVASRFHRAALLAWAPWVLPPVEDLAHGADVRLIGPRTVAIAPHRFSNKASDQSTELQKHLRIHLVFAEDGRVAERHLVEMPTGTVVARLTTDSDKVVKWFDRDGQLAHQREFPVDEAASPALKPDTQSLVVLPMPIRTPQHVRDTVAQQNADTEKSGDQTDALKKIINDQHRENQEDPVHWNEEDALRLVASYLWHDPAKLRDLIGRRYFANGDRRIGFYTLLLSSGDVWSLRQPIPLSDKTTVRMNPVKDHPQSRLARYIHRELESAQRSSLNLRQADSYDANPFIEQLSEYRRLCSEWGSDRELTTDVDERRRALDDLFKFVTTCDSPRSAYVLLRRLQRRMGTSQPHARVAQAVLQLEEKGWNSYVVKYELARSLAAKGRKQQAQGLLLDLYQTTLQSGYLPRIDSFLVKSLEDIEKSPFAEAEPLPQKGADGYLRSVGKYLIEQDHRHTAIVLAWQCRHLGRSELAEKIFADALAGVDDADLATKLAAISYLWAAKDFDRTTKLLEPLLRHELLAESPSLWWLAARLASDGGRLAQAIRYTEQAIELEFESMPDRYNVETVRKRYSELFARYQELAKLTTVSGEVPPTELVSRVIQFADRWRSLEDDVTDPCQQVSTVLAVLGLDDAAWDYLTTPLAMKPNEATAWLDLAQSLRSQRRYELASRAYRSAYESEPTNAQILWDHARLLERAGRSADAHQVYDKIARGQWQPRFQSLQQRAQRIVAEP